MSWFAVRDEDGKYWDFEGMDDYRKPLSATNRGRKWAEEVKANTGGSEIIEVVEKPAPIVVSEAEAEMLPKRYVLPMEGTKLADGTIAYATLDHTGVWTIKAYSKKQSAVAFHNTVTQAEIDAAPDWVKVIKPVEVTEE